MSNKIVSGIRVLKKYGLISAKRKWDNKKFHRPVPLDIIKKIHMVEECELNEQRKRQFSKNIKFSIITPLYNTPSDFLMELLESMKEQTYVNWELCLADGSDEKHQYVGEICLEYAKKDPRVIYKILDQNKGISENTNECIKIATGDYYGLLDHDDLLHPSALYEVMNVIEEEKADFIYTDEVRFSGKVEDINNPLAFNLKPGFGIDDLRSHNYICHFTVFNKELLNSEDEFYRKEFDGSQDHDMVLRLTEKAKKIVHVPKVLYYWRVHSQSVSMDLGTKMYAVDAAINAVGEQLKRSGELGTVVSNLPFQTIYRVRYNINSGILVSIVLTGCREAEKNISSILEKTQYRPLEIVYDSKDIINIDRNENVIITHVEENGQKTYAEKCNIMVEHTKGEYIVILDSECIPENKDWIEELLMHAQRNNVCAVSPLIYYADNTVCYAGISLNKHKRNDLVYLCSHDARGEIGYEGLLCHVRNTTSASKMCMMVKKDIWNELGGFSDQVEGYEDVDFCLKGIEAGKRNIWTCFSELTMKKKNIKEQTYEEREHFEEKWSQMFDKEKYYHPYWEILRLV